MHVSDHCMHGVEGQGMQNWCWCQEVLYVCVLKPRSCFVHGASTGMLCIHYQCRIRTLSQDTTWLPISRLTYCINRTHAAFDPECPNLSILSVALVEA